MQGTSSKNKSDICKPVQTEDDKELPIFNSGHLNGLRLCCGKWMNMEMNNQSSAVLQNNWKCTHFRTAKYMYLH